MGVCDEVNTAQTGMHWQQHERYVGPAYDPSRDLSPNLPVHSCDASSMGDATGATSASADTSSRSSGLSSAGSSGSACSTPGRSVTSSIQVPVTTSSTIHPGVLITAKIEPVAPPLSSTSPSPISPPGLPRVTSNNRAQPQETLEPGCVVCAGCGLRISDRFYLLAVDQQWHASCLQCCQCRQTLDSEATCFTRDGNIYCKKDYYRLFGMKRCARCHAAIHASELVMRARELVFHVHCFTCHICQAPLTKGDHFGMRDTAVLCRLHYEMASGAIPAPPSAESPQHQPPSMLHHHHHHHHHHDHMHPHPMLGHPSPSQPPVPPPGPSPQSGAYQPPFPSPDFHTHPPPGAQDQMASGKMPFFNGVGTPRQKGRPRKRKPKDLEAMTASLDLNAEYLDVPFGRGGPGTPGGLSGANGQQRTKRMRTSFKHHQLRTMKSYFAINHNPDAKDLKQLSQKTGLPKRVLQVWFQNARAKWRRMILKQEGKSGVDKQGLLSGGGAEGSGTGLSDLDAYTPSSQHEHGVGDFGGGHSPSDFMLSGGSPSSLDCS